MQLRALSMANFRLIRTRHIKSGHMSIDQTAVAAGRVLTFIFMKRSGLARVAGRSAFTRTLSCRAQPRPGRGIYALIETLQAMLRRHHDLADHVRMQAAEVLEGAGLRKGEAELVLRVQRGRVELAGRLDDRVRD